jgi:hypothetical protein
MYQYYVERATAVAREQYTSLLTGLRAVGQVQGWKVERVCCLLVLNSGTSTPQWIRQPEAAWLCVWCLCAWCLCVSMCSDILGSLSL